MPYYTGQYCERRWPLRVHSMNTKPVLKTREVRQILRMHARGVRVAEIAEKFGITTGHVSNIAAGRFWSEVTC